MISLVDVPELQVLIALVEVVWLLVQVLNQKLDRYKLTSLATNFARRLQQKLN